MSQYYALKWDIKPGTEEQVRELFRNYGRPDHTILDDDGNEIGTLLATQVFLREQTVVRVVETTDGISLPQLGKHMGRQPAIRALEDQLDELVAEPRDMSTAEGAARFFMSAFMELLIARRSDDT